ncbi:diacylglycerol kinase, partial [Patescibacteria group bacterium]
LIAAIFIVILMYVFSLTIIEKSILLLLIIAVLVLELSNSIMERLVDVFKPRVHNYIKDIKDIAAGAVLLTALGASAIAIIIFYPHIKDLILKWF